MQQSNDPPDDDGEAMVLRCPECKTKFKVVIAEAERTMTVKCPNGHDVPLVKAI